MFSWRQSQSLPIGLEIGAHSIRMLQLRADKAGLALQAASCADIPEGSADDPARRAAVTETIQKLLDGGDFTGKPCVSVLRPALVHARSLRLPQMPESDLAQAVQWEARDRLGFDLKDGRLVYFRAGEVRRGTEVKDEILVFGAAADVLRNHVGQITDAGLLLHAIDLQPTAMLRSVMRAHPVAAGAVTAVIDIGGGGTQLVVSQDDHLVFYKHIDIGGTALDNAIAQKLGVATQEAVQIRMGLTRQTSSAGGVEAAAPDHSAGHLDQAVMDAMRPTLEELARELDMCIRYYVVTFRGTRPDVIRLVGGQSHCPRVIDFLSTTLGIRIETAQPLRGVAELNQVTRPDRSADWAVAAGLSLYAFEAGAVEAAA